MAAGAPAGVLVYALAPHLLPGWPMSMSGPKSELLPSTYQNLPHLGRLAGRGSTMSAEKLLALRPDVIIDVGTVDNTYLSSAGRAHQQTGIPYILVDGSLPDSAKQLREVGQLLGVAARAEQLARYADEVLNAVKVPFEGASSVYLARGPDGLETGLPGSINTEVITVAGGQHATAAERGGLARVSMEQLMVWQPDMIVTQDKTFFERTKTAGVWQYINAVQNKQCFLLPDSPFGWLDGPPGINRLIGVRWLNDRLQGKSSQQEWVKHTQEFYNLFYGIEPEQTANAINSGAGFL